ncbi:MAG TPA: hypothetical protein VFY28_00355 [Candidatus Paceibacterota bacterium]|nr:hypothetical protein [Candidatus Paceibacterota bacterium]
MAMHDIIPRKKLDETPSRVPHAGDGKVFFKEMLSTIVLALIALTIIGFATQVASTPDTSLSEEELAVEREKLQSRDVIEHEVIGEGRGAVVSYSYAGEPLPAKLTQDEVVERRTSSSYTRDLGTDPASPDNHRYEAVTYARAAFVNRNGTWHYVEYDTAPKEVFDSAKKPPFSRLLAAPVAWAQSSFFAGAGDGYAERSGDSTWSTAHDSGTATGGSPTAITMTVAAVAVTAKGTTYTIDRGFLPFDTSSIPSSAIIQAATLNAYATSTAIAQLGATDYVTVVQTSQATHTTLGIGDYDNAGDVSNPTEGIDSGERKNMVSMTNGSLQAFALNSTGLGWIAKSGQSSNCSATAGITCLGLRSGLDASNTAPTNLNNQVGFHTSEASGTSVDPNLSVTYSAGFAFWQFDLF